MADVLLPQLDNYDRVGVDTETDGTGLRARPVGLSWATPDGQRAYARWGHPSGNNCTLDEVKRWAKGELGQKRSGKKCVMFNAGFDLRMLHNIGVDVKMKVEDVAFAAALVDEKEPSFSLEALSERYCPEDKKIGAELYDHLARQFGGKPTKKMQAGNICKADGGGIVEKYAEMDAVSTLALDDHYEPILNQDGLQEVYQLENRLIPFMLQMYLTGVRVNVEAAEGTTREMDKRYKQAFREWNELAPGVNYGSTKQLAPLFDEWGIPYPTTKHGNPSITKEVLERTDHPAGKLVRLMKKLDHMRGTFIKSYILDNVQGDNLIHPEFHQLKGEEYGTISGRFSSGGSMNAQNMPARDEEIAPLIRGLFIPYYEGLQWVKADYSQIEYRLFAHYAGGNIMESYRDNPMIDFHTMVAELTGLPRRHAKNVNFAMLYGAGIEKLASQIGCTLEEAEEIKKEYFRRIPEAKRLMDKCMNRATERGQVISWMGRRFKFPSNPHFGQMRTSKAGNQYKDRKKFSFTHAAINRVLQGGAADVIKTSMARIHEAGLVDWSNIFCHLTVHDELDFSAPMGERGDKFMKQMKELCEDFPNIRVPIVMDIETGRDWGHVEEWKMAA